MTKGKNAEKNGRSQDLWKPGPRSGTPKCPENKIADRRITRRITRRRNKQQLRKQIK